MPELYSSGTREFHRPDSFLAYRLSSRASDNRIATVEVLWLAVL